MEHGNQEARDAEATPDNEFFRLVGEVIIRDLTDEDRAELADPDLYPLVQIVEVLDDLTCPLCECMDGMTLDRRMLNYERWARPPHINCRRTYAYVSAEEMQIDEEGRAVRVEPTFVEPPADLVARYGHFITHPDFYAALRVPAGVEGRDFVVACRHKAKNKPPQIVVCWRVDPYLLPGLPLPAECLLPDRWARDPISNEVIIRGAPLGYNRLRIVGPEDIVGGLWWPTQ